MFYAGIDAHTKSSTICVVDRRGRKVYRCEVLSSAEGFRAGLGRWARRGLTAARVPRIGERIDDRTYIHVRTDASFLDKTTPRERLRVAEFYVYDDAIVYFLVSTSATRFGKLVGEATHRRTYGLKFIFRFPKSVLVSADYDATVKEISPYLLPVEEAATATEAAKKVEIQPGMSKEEVIKALGEPLKTIVFGKKTILKYQDITVELEDNKVVEVKAN